MQSYCDNQLLFALHIVLTFQVENKLSNTLNNLYFLFIDKSLWIVLTLIDSTSIVIEVSVCIKEYSLTYECNIINTKHLQQTKTYYTMEWHFYNSYWHVTVYVLRYIQ